MAAEGLGDRACLFGFARRLERWLRGTRGVSCSGGSEPRVPPVFWAARRRWRLAQPEPERSADNPCRILGTPDGGWLCFPAASRSVFLQIRAWFWPDALGHVSCRRHCVTCRSTVWVVIAEVLLPVVPHVIISAGVHVFVALVLSRGPAIRAQPSSSPKGSGRSLWLYGVRWRRNVMSTRLGARMR